MSRTVAVIGATTNQERFAYRAMKALLYHGFLVIPVNPTVDEVMGVPCRKDLSAISEPIDTITLYVGPDRSNGMIDPIVAAKPRRLVMNPGAENDKLAHAAESAGIEVVRGCTLVMLQDGTF